MSRLNELIRELCPNGVEFKKLGDVCYILDYKRKPISKSKRNFGNYPYYGANGIQDYIDDFLFDGTFLLIGEDSSVINKNNSPVLNWATGKIWVNNHAHVLSEMREIMLLRFLYFTLSETNISDIVRGTPPKLNQENLRNIKLPVPPLDVQNEIVRILDTFTSHAAELQAELQARKEQYEYYRNKLLTFDKDDKNVKWMKLGEIGTFIRGNGLQKKDFTETGFPCIHYGQIHTHYGTFADTTISHTSFVLAEKLRKASYGDLVIATTSEDVDGVCKACAWLGENDVAVSGDAYIYKHNQNPKYISYLFQTKRFYEYKRKASVGAKVVRVSGDSMKNFIFPIPSISEQTRIVSILDKFEALVNDLTEGLPAEIAAVQEQYEYYRNKLLTFKQRA